MAERERPAIVVLASVHWTAIRQRHHHLPAEFARRGHRVVVVEPDAAGAPGTWTTCDRDTGDSGISVVQLGLGAATSIWGEWSAADRVAALRALGSLVDDDALRCPILFVQHPSWQPLVALALETTDFPVVYDCSDLHGAWPAFERDTLDALEAELAADADLVLASSPDLVTRMEALQRHVLHVPNGCDPATFERNVPGGRLCPPLRGPLIGYVGDVAEIAFDVGLLVAVAESRPDWTFVIVGPVAASLLPSLDRLANVVLLGPTPYEELPELLADIDVAIVPFRLTELTRAVDPVKVWEYLAAGKPVVATPLPALHPLQGVVALAHGPQEFAAAIQRALDTPDSTGAVAERRAVARTASWSRRVDLFHAEMLACLPSLDVVVISYDNPGPLRRTLASLERDDSHASHLIVVDNASTAPETIALLDAAERDGATVLRNPENAGYPAAVNQGVAAGTGRYLLLLNDDVQLPRGGTLAFVHALARSRSVGIVGPVTNRIANQARIDVPYADGTIPPPDQIDAIHRRRTRDWSGVRFELQVTALFAAALRRRDFEGSGGLSEHYLLGQFEDDELAERLRQRGLKVVCCEELFVHHDGSSSFGALDPQLLHGVFERNRRVYEATTGAVVTPHQLRREDHTPPAPGTV